MSNQYQFFEESEKNIVICPWRAIRFFADADAEGIACIGGMFLWNGELREDKEGEKQPVE